MRALLRTTGAEWTKFWSVRSTWWCLLGTGAMMGLAALTLGADAASPPPGPADPLPAFPATQPVVDSAIFFQFGVVALAMLVVTAEYASGAIRSTLQAVPVRGRLLAAKALVVAVTVAVVTALGGLVTAVVVWALLSLEPFQARIGLHPMTTTLDLLRLAVYAACIAGLSVGVSFALRSAAGSLTVVFLLLAGVPVLLAMSGNEVLVQIMLRMPLMAGLAFMGSVNNPAGPLLDYPAWEGLAWLAAWTAAALATGHAILRRRDA
jgi:ABC-2 type transport system permease protein